MTQLLRKGVADVGFWQEVRENYNSGVYGRSEGELDDRWSA